MAMPRKVHAKIIRIIDFGCDVYKIEFSDFNIKLPKIKSGEFLHLAIDSFDPSLGFWPDSRVFSIAALNFSENTLSILYSVKGLFTKRMKEELFIGKSVWLKLPYGDFCLERSIIQDVPVVFIAGGTGISPYMPFLTNLKKLTSYTQPFHLFYGFRNESLFLFNKELYALANDFSNIKMKFYCEKILESNNRIQIGKLQIKDIYASFAYPEKNTYFISGPPLMVKSFKEYLVQKNINEKQVIIDKWE